MPAYYHKLQVFLCHASQDKHVVHDLYQQLLAEEWIEPWLDIANILPGQHWTTIIKEVITTADIVIILISNNSISKEGFIQREMNYAWEKSLEKPRSIIFLIPLRLEDCDIPYDLRDRQWADFFGNKKEGTYKALLKSLKLRHEQKLRLESEEQTQNQVNEKIRQNNEKHKQSELEDKSRQEKKEQDQKRARERVKHHTELLLQKQEEEKARLEQENTNKNDHSLSNADQFYNNTVFIVIVVLFLCCFCSAIGGGWWLWNNGDSLMSAAVQALA